MNTALVGRIYVRSFSINIIIIFSLINGIDNDIVTNT